MCYRHHVAWWYKVGFHYWNISIKGYRELLFLIGIYTSKVIERFFTLLEYIYIHQMLYRVSVHYWKIYTKQDSFCSLLDYMQQRWERVFLQYRNIYTTNVINNFCLLLEYIQQMWKGVFVHYWNIYTKRDREYLFITGI